MSKRYYLSRYTTKVVTGETAYVPVLMTYPNVTVGAINAPDPAAPNAWALCIVETLDHTTLQADNRCRVLPDAVLDLKLTALGTQARRRLSDALTEYGLDASAILASADAMRDVLRAIGRTHDGGFSEERFDAVTA